MTWKWKLSYAIDEMVIVTITSIAICQCLVELEVCISYDTALPILVISWEKLLHKKSTRTSLMVQWLRIHLPMQGTRVQALVREDPTCLRATKPVCHHYWACALEPASHNNWARAPQLLKPTRPGAHAPQLMSPRTLGPICCNYWSPRA